MNIREWHHGCRVSVTDWIGTDSDGQTPIRIGVEYFIPGASLNNPPAWERVLYCPRREEQKIRDFIDSITWNVLTGNLKPSRSYFAGELFDADDQVRAIK